MVQMISLPQQIKWGLGSRFRHQTRCSLFRQSLRQIDQNRAFSLVEMILTSLILGVFASIAISSMNSSIRRERINSLALNIAAWVEEVRNKAANNVQDDSESTSSNPINGGCAITWKLPISGKRAGEVIAEADAGCQARERQLKIPSDVTSPVSLESSNGNSIIFTPRGLWIANPAVTDDLVIKMVLDGIGPLRCVRISETLASVDIGRGSANSLSGDCSEYQKL